MNQTLVRSINTSIVALLPVGAILYVGAVSLGTGALKDLALALFVGMAAGTYSSIFIATPLAVQLKSGEKEITQQDARAKARTRRDVDRYADVPVFTDDLPVRETPEGFEPEDDVEETGGAGEGTPAASRGVRLRPRRAGVEGARPRVGGRQAQPAEARAPFQARQVRAGR